MSDANRQKGDAEMKSLMKILLYAGLEEKQFRSLIPKVYTSNRKSLKIYSLLAAMAFTGLFVASRVTHSFADVNQQLYGTMMLLNIGIYLCARLLLPKTPSLIQPTGYLFMGSLYVFSLSVTALHPEYPAVSIFVLLFAVPFLLICRPVSEIALTLLVMVGLCLVSYCFKAPELAVTDYWNTVSFGFVAIAVATVQQCNQYKMLYQEEKLVYLSNTDLLTGAKNRNRFENRKTVYAHLCDRCLSVIYIDVNGLHALNDSKGHLAGDRLLIAAAHAMIAEFGEDHTYRIGGDEFVCFSLDTGEEEVEERMQRIERTLDAQGYSISWGAATEQKAVIDMHSMTTSAEAEMYAAKDRYYQQPGHERRR